MITIIFVHTCVNIIHVFSLASDDINQLIIHSWGSLLLLLLDLEKIKRSSQPRIFHSYGLNWMEIQSFLVMNAPYVLYNFEHYLVVLRLRSFYIYWDSFIMLSNFIGLFVRWYFGVMICWLWRGGCYVSPDFSVTLLVASWVTNIQMFKFQNFHSLVCK